MPKLAGTIRATFGLRGSSSLRSAALSSSLVNRLKARLDTVGSIVFAMTWKLKTTPSGRVVCLLRARARSTSDSACGSWPTPAANEPGGTPEQAHQRKLKALANGSQLGTTPATVLSHAAQLASWPTPNTPSGGRSVSIEKMSATGMTQDGRKHTVSLEHVAKFASWPTPMVNDELGSEYCYGPMRPDGTRPKFNKLPGAAALAAWATPRAEDSESTGAHRGTPDTLTSQTRMASWASPATRDWKDSPGMATTGTNPDGTTRERNDQLQRQAYLTSGAMSTGSIAETAKRGQLDPAHSRWLQGYQPAWDDCAVTAMQLCRKSRKRSSKRTAKRGSLHDR